MEYSTKELIKIINNDDPKSAIDEVETKLRIINRELTGSNIVGRNDMIHQIQSRVKTLGSIIAKLDRTNSQFSKISVEKELADVAGIRVICSYVDDIYAILNSLSHQTDISILEVKNYIENPKPSGYRSLHVILEIPVFFFKETKQVKVEI